MTAAVRQRPSIYVLAGVNGAGKSSVAGAMFRSMGADYFNPDEATRDLLLANSGMTLATANELAWNIGKQRLERAIASASTFAFETTLGGNTMVRLLEQAMAKGMAVRVWYVGLENVALHRTRVASGGHDIPEDKIRARFDQSRLNLIRLLPGLAQLRLFDNSADGYRRKTFRPTPLLLMRMRDGAVEGPLDLNAIPHWAKPIVLAAPRRCWLSWGSATTIWVRTVP